MNKLIELEKISLKKWIKPGHFCKIKCVSSYNFSDTSEAGYDQSSCLRIADEKRIIYCTSLMEKSKVTSRKLVSIPRLEFVAAIVSVKVSNLIKSELRIGNLQEYSYTSQHRK